MLLSAVQMYPTVGDLSIAAVNAASGLGGAAGASAPPRPPRPPAPPRPPRPPRPAGAAAAGAAGGGGFMAVMSAFRSSSVDQRRMLMFTARPASLTLAEVAVSVVPDPAGCVCSGRIKRKRMAKFEGIDPPVRLSS